MNDLMRPALYDAWHEITPIHAEARASARYDVVGPVCETGDTFAIDRELPACAAGDLVMIKGAGAYGALDGVELQLARRCWRKCSWTGIVTR